MQHHRLAHQLIAQSLREGARLRQVVLERCADSIANAAAVVTDALLAGNKILIFGNGGSAADAQHIAAELIGYYESQRKSWPAIALTTDTSALTAVSNDLGFEHVFARQVAGLAQAGDVLIAISTSGKSKNVLRALEQAKESGCKTIFLTGTLTGAAAETLSSLCDAVVAVPGTRTSRVQEAHITIGHLWCEMVDQIS
jgi:D-sedoheptulose 7-phosphate isomerase